MSTKNAKIQRDKLEILESSIYKTADLGGCMAGYWQLVNRYSIRKERKKENKYGIFYLGLIKKREIVGLKRVCGSLDSIFG